MNDETDRPKCSRCGTELPGDAPEGLCPRCLMALNLATETELPGESGPHGTAIAKPAPQAPPDTAEIARLFPELEIIEYLGRGGMGLVYKARQRRLNRLVALKLLSRERMDAPHFAERFEREAQALARLNHSSIVAVYEFGQVNNTPFFIMEFVDGLNLRQLEQAGKLSPADALQIIPQICEALQYAHEEGIVHRDIKPENILIDRKGRVKIADFGIAKILGREADVSHLTQAAQVMGTPHYMAPEQVEKPQAVDHRADIYSLGVVFYEMLTGELPLGKFQPPSRKVHIDVRLDEIVLHALEKEPERRYQYAKQVKTDVETIATSAGAPSPEAVASFRKGPGVTGWVGRVVGILGVAFLLMFISAEGFPPFWKQPGAVQVELLAMLIMLAGLITGWKSPFWGAFLIVDGWLVFAVAEGGWPPVPFTAFLLVAALYAHSWWSNRKAAPVLASVQETINQAEWQNPQNWTGPKWLSIYFSNRDSRTVVPKQIPALGWTVNLGSTKGCATLLGLILAITVLAASVPHWPGHWPFGGRIPGKSSATKAAALTPIPPQAKGVMDAYMEAAARMGRAAISNDVPAWEKASKAMSEKVQEFRKLLKGTIAEAPLEQQLKLMKEMSQAAKAGNQEKLGSLRTEIEEGGKAFEAMIRSGAELSGKDRDKSIAQIKREQAEAELKRIEQLRQQKAVSEEKYNQAKANRDIARDELAGDQAEVARIKIQMAEAELQRVEILQKDKLVSVDVVEQARANRDATRAEAAGDKVELARVKRDFQEQQFARAEQRFQLGLITRLEFERFKGNRDIAALEYEQALAAAKRLAPPSTSSTNAKELPQLRFLAWQDENPSQENWKAWHPDGSPVQDEHELKLLSRVGVARFDLSATREAKKNPRCLHLWFSHPDFDKDSDKEVKLYTNGVPLPLAGGGSATSTAHSPEPDNDNLGWIIYTLSPGNMGQTPLTLSLGLQYSMGEWELGREIESTFNGSMALGEGAYLNGFGQGAEGKAFVPVAVDLSRSHPVQYDFLALTKDGRTLPSSGHSFGGPSDGPLQAQRFEFSTTLDSIRAFRLRTRPIHMVFFKRVSAAVGHVTTPTITRAGDFSSQTKNLRKTVTAPAGNFTVSNTAATLPLSYQWRFNSTNSLGATNNKTER